MTDADRERLIASAGYQLQAWMAEYERTSCFSTRGTADFWRLRMEALIRERSPEQVRAMELERGLA